MSPTVREPFEASNLVAILTRIVVSPAPTRILIMLDGPIRGLAGSVRLRSMAGRVTEVRAGGREGVRALALAFTSEKGWVETAPDSTSSVASESLPALSELFAASRERSDAFLRLVSGLGGLAGRLYATPYLEAGIAAAPAPARQLARRCDGRKTVVELLADVPMDEVLGARVLRRLVDDRGLEVVDGSPPEWPEAQDSREFLPSTRPVESGARWGTAEFMPWLEPKIVPSSTGRHPGPSLGAPSVAGSSLEAPSSLDRPRFPETSTTDRVRKTRASTSRGSEWVDEAVFRDAGVADSPFRRWMLISGLGGGLVVLALVFSWWEREPPEPPKRAAIAEPPSMPIVSPDSVRPTIAAPDAPEDVRRAEALLDAQRYAEAESLLEVLRRTRPNDAAVFILSGQVFADTGRLESAQQMAVRAIEIDPRSYRAWVLKGSVSQFRGRKQQALSAYEHAIELGPEHPMTSELRTVMAGLRR